MSTELLILLLLNNIYKNQKHTFKNFLCRSDPVLLSTVYRREIKCYSDFILGTRSSNYFLIKRNPYISPPKENYIVNF